MTNSASYDQLYLHLVHKSSFEMFSSKENMNKIWIWYKPIRSELNWNGQHHGLRKKNNICHPKINHCTLPCTFVIECIYWCLTICLQLQCMNYMMCIAVDITQLPGNHCTLLPRYTMPPTTALEENKIFTWHLMVYFSPILSIHSEIQ